MAYQSVVLGWVAIAETNIQGAEVYIELSDGSQAGRVSKVLKARMEKRGYFVRAKTQQNVMGNTVLVLSFDPEQELSKILADLL